MKLYKIEELSKELQDNIIKEMIKEIKNTYGRDATKEEVLDLILGNGDMFTENGDTVMSEDIPLFKLNAEFKENLKLLSDYTIVCSEPLDNGMSALTLKNMETGEEVALYYEFRLNGEGN